MILTGRDPERLRSAAADVEALSSTAFDANDPAKLARFFEELPKQVDHVLVTAGLPPTGRSSTWTRTRRAGR